MPCPTCMTEQPLRPCGRLGYGNKTVMGREAREALLILLFACCKCLVPAANSCERLHGPPCCQACGEQCPFLLSMCFQS